jgi:uncharacterized protein YggE
MFILKKIPILLCLAAVLFLGLISPAQAAETTFPSVTATGESLQEYLPDTAHVTLAIETQSVNQNDAQSQNAVLSNRILAEILAFGVKERDIKTTNFQSNPQYKYYDSNSRKMPEIIGYNVLNSMTVSVPADKAGQLIDLALKSGATRVGNVRFSLEDNAKIQQEVVALAVKDAMNKIEAIVNALGKRIVRIQSVTENGTSIRSAMPEARMMAMDSVAKENSVPTPISAGTVNIMSNVQITVVIE